MRIINYYSEKPKATEVIPVGKRAVVFIRTGIEKVAGEDEEGNEQISWKAVEYQTEVNALKFEVTKDFIDKLIEQETEAEAEKVRKKRNDLLDATDKEMMVDRIENEDEAEVSKWKNYRQALRDLPEQEGFPFDIEWPKKP